MASVNKINLCDETQSKLAGATLTCKPVLLPAYADDVLLVTKCGLSGQVEATLQHSPDGVRWSNCQVKKIESSSGTASFGNEWHLDLIPKASEVENKHLLQYSNFGGVTDQDVTTAFMAHDKPFNLSMWLKSEEIPATSVTPSWGGDALQIRPSNSLGQVSFRLNGTKALIATDKDWTFSFWWKAGSGSTKSWYAQYGLYDMDHFDASRSGLFYNYSGAHTVYKNGSSFSKGYGKYGSISGADTHGGYTAAHGVIQFGTLGYVTTGSDVTASSGLWTAHAEQRDQHNKQIVNPNDREWHHFVYTWKASSTHDWYYKGTTHDPATEGFSMYVDGWLVNPNETYHNSITVFGSGQGYITSDDDIHLGTTNGSYDQKFLQVALFDGHVQQADVDKMYGSSTAGALDGKPQREHELSLDFDGDSTAECKLFNDFSTHADFKTSSVAGRIQHPAHAHQGGAFVDQYAFQNLADSSAAYTTPTSGSYSATDLGWDSTYKTIYKNIYSDSKWSAYDLSGRLDTSGDATVFSASVIDTTYSPILFRCGGKIADANAFDNIQSLNLAEGTGESKNKYLKADNASQTAIDSGSDASDAFTYSTWFKTNTDPATTAPINYPTRYFNIPVQPTNNYKQGNGIEITSLGDDGSGNHSGPIGDTKPWSVSFWIKNPDAGVILDFNGENSDSDKDNGQFRIGISSSTGQIYLYRIQWASTFMDAQFTGDLTADTDWHHIVLSYKNTKADNTTVWNRLGHSGTSYTKDDFWSVDPTLNGPTSSINDMGFTLYIDGVRAPYDAANSAFANVDTTWFTSWLMTAWQSYGMGPYTPEISKPAIMLGQKYHGSGAVVEGNFANLAFHSETISAAKALSLYNSGNPTDLSADSNCIVLLNPEGITAGTSISDDTVLTNSGGSSSSSNHTCTVVGNAGDSAYSVDVEDATSESLYYAMTPAETIYSPILFRCGGKTVEDSGKIKSFFNNPAPNSGATSHMIEIPGIAADGTAGATQIVGNTKDWTASFWYKGTDTNGGTIFALGNNANLMNDKGLEFYSTSSTHGSLVIKVGNGNGGYYDFYSSYGATYAICDGDWHHVVLTYKGVASDGNTYQLDAHATSESTPGFSVYIDGAHQVLKTANSSHTSHTSPFGDSAADVYKAICNWIGRRGTTGWGTQHGEFTDLAIFNEMKTAAQILAMYNSGSPTDLTVDSSCVSLLRADDMTTATSLSDGTVIANSSTHADASTYVATWDHGGAGGVGTLDVVDLTASDSIYRAPVAANNFGDGMTISITDKYADTTGAYVASGNQPNKLIVSMDGFENTADEIMVYPEDVVDDAWHNLVVTHDGGPGNDLEVHIDGSQKTSLTSLSGSLAANHLKNDTDTAVGFVIGGSGIFESSGVNAGDSEYNFQGEIMDTSFHSEDLSNKTSDFYNSGTPADLDKVSGIDSAKIECWWKIEENAADEAPQGKNSRHLTLNNFEATTDSTIDIPSTDIRYFKESRFGEGITISLTDKVKTSDGTWNVNGGEAPHLLISFNGFENDADQWVAWKCEQTDINPIVTETTSANLLDGEWHNLILSYRGVTSAGDPAAFGRGGTSGHDNAYWHLGWNGLKTDHLNSYHGVDASKSAATGENVTLAMQDYHLKNVSDTYVRTSFFASGFLEDGADSPYAFQGQIDETSFDSSTWWRNPIGSDPGTFCDCPLEVVYGNNDQRLTLPVGTANDNYAFTLLSLAPGKPHDLLDPLSVNTDPINNQKAYIDPYPTGQFRCSDGIGAHTTKAICDANHSIHSSPKGLGEASTPPFSAGNTNWIGANENFPGGIEWYYRWGDVATDCKVCVNDARAFTLGVSAGEPAVAETVTDRSAAIKGTLSVGDLKASVSSNSGGAETIYVEGSSGGGGTTITYEDLVNDCVLAGDNVITHLNIPHLHHLRLVYTGSSACVAGSCSIGGHNNKAACEAASGIWTEGECIGDLFYSTRRKG